MLIRKLCFVCFLVGFMVLWVMLRCSHCIVFVFWTCIYTYAIVLHWMHIRMIICFDHLLCYVIIVVISIWMFWCMIKLLTSFISCLLDHNLLVTLYLSFYYLLYLEGLICLVQVFQVTSVYVPSASQLLIILKGREILSTFSLYCLSFYSVFCGLCPCCFCKLLGFVSMIL